MQELETCNFGEGPLNIERLVGIQSQPQQNGAIIQCLADVKPQKVEFLWDPYLPRDKLILVEGNPGDGKTYFSLALMSGITRGFLPGVNGQLSPITPQNCLYIGIEDGIGDTIRPRLDATGADVSKIFTMTGTKVAGEIVPWSFDDIKTLDETMSRIQPALVVIDPLQGFIGSHVDLYRANETRPKMAALAQLAEKHHAAIMIIRHLSKSGNQALYRGLGSIDFTAVARSVLLIGKEDDSELRVMIHLKSSCAPAGPTQAFVLSNTGFAWAGTTATTADDLLFTEKKKPGETKLDRAMDWLEDFLADGPKTKQEVDKAARRKGINVRTLRTAKEKLKVKSCKRPGEQHSPWVWRLPDEEE
ncbi:MAG: AAA family ATPase [Candidatus Desulforudis sp.]|nr:AAA family ATPase [Desulforudis sp.]